MHEGQILCKRWMHVLRKRPIKNKNKINRKEGRKTGNWLLTPVNHDGYIRARETDLGTKDRNEVKETGGREKESERKTETCEHPTHD